MQGLVMEESKRNKYYGDIRIQIELINCMQGKEVILMSHTNHAHCIRGLSFRNISYLNYVKNFYDLGNRDYNIYISVGFYRFIPSFDLNLKVRSTYTHKWFTDQAQQEIIDYDIFLDFDGKLKDFKKMLSEVIAMTRLLNKHKVKYYIIPSGSSYQIVIKNFGYPQKDIKDLTQAIKDKFNFKTLDMIGIGSYYKIMKCPYSLCQDTICYPLDSDMIEGLTSLNYRHFKVDKIKPEKIYQRGIPWQFKRSDQEELKAFINYFNLNGGWP